MLEEQGYYKSTDNAAGALPDPNRSQADTDIRIISDATDSSYINSLLESTFNIMGDNIAAKDAVSSALMALNQYLRL